MVPQEGVQVNEYSTTRRTVTGVLVLIAAGLLGYVLYDNLLNTSQSVPAEPVSVEVDTPITVEQLSERLDQLQPAALSDEEMIGMSQRLTDLQESDSEQLSAEAVANMESRLQANQ